MESGSGDQGDTFGRAKPRLRLVTESADDFVDGPLVPIEDSDELVRSARLVREYKGPTADDLIAESELERISERLSAEMDAVLREIERGDLEAADRILDGGLDAQRPGDCASGPRRPLEVVDSELVVDPRSGTRLRVVWFAVALGLVAAAAVRLGLAIVSAS